MQLRPTLFQIGFRCFSTGLFFSDRLHFSESGHQENSNETDTICYLLSPVSDRPIFFRQTSFFGFKTDRINKNGQTFALHIDFLKTVNWLCFGLRMRKLEKKDCQRRRSSARSPGAQAWLATPLRSTCGRAMKSPATTSVRAPASSIPTLKNSPLGCRSMQQSRANSGSLCCSFLCIYGSRFNDS